MVHSRWCRKLCTLLALVLCVQTLFSEGAPLGVTEVQAAAKVVFAKSIRSFVLDRAEMLDATDSIVVPKVINYIDVYKSDSTSSGVAGRMYRGTAAYPIRKKGACTYISSGNLIGWIENRILVGGKKARAFVNEMVPRVATVKKAKAAVRKAPRTSAARLVTVPKGHRMTALAIEGKWVKVRLAKYDVGYIKKSSLKLEKGLFYGTTLAEERKVEACIEQGYWSEDAGEKEAEEEKQEESEEQKDGEDRETPKGTWESLGEFTLTAYCPCAKCNGSANAGKTATGVKPAANHTIAVDRTVIPLGRKIKIAGSDTIYVAEDTGVKGKHIDIFHDTHSQALDFGVARREVYILKED